MGFSVVYSIRDEKGAVSTTEINLPAATSFHDVAIFAGQMALIINPLIRGAITRIGVCYMLTLPAGLRTTPLTGSDVEEGARFQFKTSNGFYTSNRIPTFDESLVIPGTREVDLLDPNVSAFYIGMNLGLNTSGATFNGVSGTGVISPSDSRGDDIVRLEGAVEQFLSSRGRS